MSTSPSRESASFDSVYFHSFTNFPNVNVQDCMKTWAITDWTRIDETSLIISYKINHQTDTGVSVKKITDIFFPLIVINFF